MKHLTLILAFVLAVSSLTVCKVSAGTYDNWQYSKLLTFSTGTEGLQVNFNVTYGGTTSGCEFNCQTDFDDLRFTDAYNGALLPAYNETTVESDYVNIWLTLGSTLEVVMHYGNPDATPYWNATAVFNDVIGDVVLALPMNEGSGSTVYDYSGNGYSGDIYGSPSWENGLYNEQNIDYDGVDDYITQICGNVSDFTVVYWLRWKNSSTYYEHPCEMGVNDLAWYHDDSNYFAITGDVNAYVGDVPLNSWYHTGVFQNETGVWVMSNSSVLLNEHSAQVVFESGSDYYFSVSGVRWKGNIAHFYMWNRSLTQVELDNVFDESFYLDSTLLEGSVCCREWISSMPTVTFGDETPQTTTDDILAISIALTVTFTIIPIIIIYAKRKKEVG